VTFTVGTEPPCSYTGDHRWHGGICTSCGARLRCCCGQYWDGSEAHYETCSVMKGCPEEES